MTFVHILNVYPGGFWQYVTDMLLLSHGRTCCHSLFLCVFRGTRGFFFFFSLAAARVPPPPPPPPPLIVMLSILGGKSQDNSKRLCCFYAKKDLGVSGAHYGQSHFQILHLFFQYPLALSHKGSKLKTVTS